MRKLSKRLSLILAVIVCLPLILMPVVSAEDDPENAIEYIYEENFDSIPVQSFTGNANVGSNFNVESTGTRFHIVGNPEGGNCLYFDFTDSPSQAGFATQADLTKQTGKFVFSMDYKILQFGSKWCGMLLITSDAWKGFFNITADGFLQDRQSGNRQIELTENEWFNVTVCFDTATGKYDMYYNGEIFVKASTLSTKQDLTVQKIRPIHCEDKNAAVGAKAYIDNLKVYMGVSAPEGKIDYIVNENYNFAPTGEITSSYFISGQQTYVGSKAVDGTSGVFTIEEEANNLYDKYLRTDLLGPKGTDGRVDSSVHLPDSYKNLKSKDSVVISLSYKLEKIGTKMSFMFRKIQASDGTTRNTGIFNIEKDGRVQMNAKPDAYFYPTVGEWFDISLVLNLETITYDFYVNGVLYFKNLSFGFANGDVLASVTTVWPEEFNLTEANTTIICVDNVRIYYGTVPDDVTGSRLVGVMNYTKQSANTDITGNFGDGLNRLFIKRGAVNGTANQGKGMVKALNGDNYLNLTQIGADGSMSRGINADWTAASVNGEALVIETSYKYEPAGADEKFGNWYMELTGPSVVALLNGSAEGLVTFKGLDADKYKVQLLENEFIKFRVELDLTANTVKYYVNGVSVEKAVKFLDDDTVAADYKPGDIRFVRCANNSSVSGAAVSMDNNYYFLGTANTRTTSAKYINTCDAVYVGLQLSEAANGVYMIRFAATINSLNYKEIGFKIQATKNSAVSNVVVMKTSTVYTKLIGYENGIKEEYLPETFGAAYIYALTVDNVPVADGIVSYSITPFTTSISGKTVLGESVIVVIDAGAFVSQNKVIN